MYNVYMNYTIYLTNDADYNAILGLSGGNPLIAISPRGAAYLLGIPYPYPTGDLQTIDKTILFTFPFAPGLEIGFPGPSGIFVDDTVDSQIVPGQSGNPPGSWPPGQDATFIWSGNLIKANGGAGTAPIPLNAIPQRRWIGGSEWTPLGEGGSGVQAFSSARDASRTIDGKGLALRGDNVSSWLRTVAGLRTALVSATSWERFYVRFRSLPSAVDMGFWRCHGAPSNACGFGLLFNTAGEVRGVSINSVSTQADKGVVWTPVPNTWYLVDILIKFAANGGGRTGVINIYINHVLTFQFTDNAGYGLNNATSHNNSELGKWTGTDKDCEIDLDDWICADLPGNCDATTLQFLNTNYPVDWLMGSHVRKQYSVTANLGTFVGNLEALNQGDSPLTALTNLLTSSTSGDLLEALTDALPQDSQDTIAAILGAVAGIISIYSTVVNDTDGQLGYRIAGGAAVLTTIDQTAAGKWNSIGYLPIGVTLPTEISPFDVVHSKSVDANLDTTYAIVTVVEYIGVWGPEDYPSFVYPISRLTNLHNCKYENTGWGYFGAVPAAPVYSLGGTYVGNGGYQAIALPVPCHFLWIRALTGGDSGGVKLFGTSLVANLGIRDRVIPNIRVFTDNLGVTKFIVSGDDAVINKTGVTYQYIAFCDPGMRFNLCGEFIHNTSSVPPKINLLIDSLFTPECGFAQKQTSNSASNVVGLSFKGPGQAGNVGNSLDGTAKNNWGNFAAGVMNSLADLHYTHLPCSYSLWRTTESGCAGVMVQVCTYTGDGTGARTIPITPASGRFPLFVMVIPASGGVAYFRDPSHTGTDSSAADTDIITNAKITAVAVDAVTVGTTLNTNGVVYHIFCFPGSDVGMLNGVYYNPECLPSTGAYINPVNMVGDIILLPNGGIDLGGSVVVPTPIVALEDLSGMYTIVPGQTHDIIQDRLVGQPTLNYKIPNPYFKTGYIGG